MLIAKSEYLYQTLISRGRRKGKRGRGSHNKMSVFGILERNGTVKVDILQDVTAESILNMTIKTVRRG